MCVLESPGIIVEFEAPPFTAVLVIPDPILLSIRGNGMESRFLRCGSAKSTLVLGCLSVGTLRQSVMALRRKVGTLRKNLGTHRQSLGTHRIVLGPFAEVLGPFPKVLGPFAKVLGPFAKVLGLIAKSWDPSLKSWDPSLKCWDPSPKSWDQGCQSRSFVLVTRCSQCDLLLIMFSSRCYRGIRTKIFAFFSPSCHFLFFSRFHSDHRRKSLCEQCSLG